MIPTNAAPGLRIVVLAAGFSVRLGRSKAVSSIRGATLLRRTLVTVAPLTAAPVIVVLPPRAARVRAELRGHRVEFAESRHRAQGLSASVKCGLRRARYAAAVLLLPVDLPRLNRREVECLIARWRPARRTVVARRVDSSDRGARAGAPLVLPRRLYVEARRIVGDLGLRDLVNRLGPDELRLVDLPSGAADVDTPADLDAARRTTRGSRASRPVRQSHPGNSRKA
jgi:molybdenum cofactor cytidylyltransferase